MIYLLLYLAIFPIRVIATWVLFLAIMRLQEMRDAGKISPVAKPVATVALGVGYFMDAWINLDATFIFFDIPREPLLSPRVSRLKKSTGWRAKLATFICTHFLDPVDPSGCHCK